MLNAVFIDTALPKLVILICGFDYFLSMKSIY